MRVNIDDYSRGDFIEGNGNDAWLITYEQANALLAKGLIFYCEDCNDEQDMRNSYHPVGTVPPEAIEKWIADA